jgi:hypothetical protein
MSGAVSANAGGVGPRETFRVDNAGGNDIALWSHQGYFSRQANGTVEANRSQVGVWEKWSFEDNGDGTVSLKSIYSSNYLIAENGGGDACNANRPNKGVFEKFHRLDVPGGIALRTLKTGHFVSVSP